MSPAGGDPDDPSLPGPGTPNPFSREGATAGGSTPTDPTPTGPPPVAPTTAGWPGYPPAGPEPGPRDDTTGWPGPPQPDIQQGYRPAPSPGPYPPAEVAPYGPTASYDPTNPYVSNPDVPNPYGSNPYAPSPFAPSAYGLGSPYGVAPQHPQAVTALVLGIVGLVVCPPVGIAGIVTGLRVRRDCDAQPGQFTGRGLGTAGLVLGIVSIVVMIFWIVVVAGVFAADY